MYKGRFIVRQNFPVITCWPTTIHKAQGLSLKSAAIAIGNSVFQHGQAYVALGRVEKFDNLYLLSFSEQSLFLWCSSYKWIPDIELEEWIYIIFPNILYNVHLFLCCFYFVIPSVLTYSSVFVVSWLCQIKKLSNFTVFKNFTVHITNHIFKSQCLHLKL